VAEGEGTVKWRDIRDGDVVVKRGFLWFPVRCGGIAYWLETRTVTKRLHENWGGGSWEIESVE